jgi:hypothetical protein
MTAQTEALPGPPVPKPQAGAEKVGAFIGSAISGGTLSALASWVAGTAVSSGWHVSLPFLPTWLLVLVGLLVAGHFTSVVAYFWHVEKGKTAAQIAAQVKGAEVIAEGLARAYMAKGQ